MLFVLDAPLQTQQMCPATGDTGCQLTHSSSTRHLCYTCRASRHTPFMTELWVPSDHANMRDKHNDQRLCRSGAPVPDWSPHLVKRASRSAQVLGLCEEELACALVSSRRFQTWS